MSSLHCPTCGGRYKAKNGTGTVLAGDFKSPSPKHLEIINSMLLYSKDRRAYTKQEMFSILTKYLETLGKKPYVWTFKTRVSELVFLGLFRQVDKDIIRKISPNMPPINLNKPRYVFNRIKAEEIVKTGKY